MQVISRKPALILFFAALMLATVVTVPAVDYASAAHLGLEPDLTGNYGVNAGIDLRLLGGRGMWGWKTSVDYLTTNMRGYNGNVATDMFVITSYGLMQASILYGDLTFFTGPGTSFYIIPGDDLYASVTNDNLFHYTLGAMYRLYPLNFFIEAETDIDYLTWNLGLNRTRFKVGVGIMSN